MLGDQPALRGLAHHREVRNTPVGDEMLRAAATPAVGGPLVTHHRVALDLAAYAREQDVPPQIRAGFRDRFRGGDERGHPGLHVVDPHAVDPAVLDMGDRPVAGSIRQIGLVTGERHVDVTVEQERGAVTAAVYPPIVL